MTDRGFRLVRRATPVVPIYYLVLLPGASDAQWAEGLRIAALFHLAVWLTQWETDP